MMLPLLSPPFSTRFGWKNVFFIKSIVKNGNYDFVYFDFSQTFIYSIFVSHPNKILMVHDVLYQKYKRRGLFPRWTLHTERVLLKNHTHIFTFSQKDCILLKELYGVQSLPTSFFIQEEAVRAVPQSVDKPYFVFFAAWNRNVNYESLEWFIGNVLGLIPTNVMFRIIGKGMPSWLAKKIEGIKNVEIVGFVDNPYQEIANAQALISPLHDGAGVKVKVIESLACGTPVIGTDISFEGISEEYSTFMHKAETPDQFFQEVASIQETTQSKIEFKKYFLETYNRKPILNLFVDSVN
jgi:glycosyltransferase involved in cell wall biosynthesis